MHAPTHASPAFVSESPDPHPTLTRPNHVSGCRWQEGLREVDILQPTGLDLWALGVLLYELIVGVLPFHGDTPEEFLAGGHVCVWGGVNRVEGGADGVWGEV